MSGSPIFSKYFRPMTVMAIDGRSYVLGDGHPVDAKYPCRTKVGIAKADHLYFDDDGKEDSIWVNSHRARLSDLLRSAGADKLREVAAVLGFDLAVDASGVISP
jgi:hypothetical protein